MLLRSSQLSGVSHGFSTRNGGVSPGRYATLNLGDKWGDDPVNVAENRRRLAAAGDFVFEQLLTVKQVHGATVMAVGASTERTRLAATEADALVTELPGVGLGIYTADCVPIVMVDSEGRVGAAHAGWRGTVRGVAAATVEALVALGGRRETIRVALGPSICRRCFEVGEEVASQFDAMPGAVLRDSARPRVDLRRANRQQLIAAGVSPLQIDAEPPCTHCDSERFFSYRRDGAGTGQQLSFVFCCRR